MRNALNKLADTVEDPAEKKVSLMPKHTPLYLMDSRRDSHELLAASDGYGKVHVRHANVR